jgi:hypothetical protein
MLRFLYKDPPYSLLLHLFKFYCHEFLKSPKLLGSGVLFFSGQFIYTNHFNLFAKWKILTFHIIVMEFIIQFNFFLLKTQWICWNIIFHWKLNQPMHAISMVTTKFLKIQMFDKLFVTTWCSRTDYMWCICQHFTCVLVNTIV